MPYPYYMPQMQAQNMQQNTGFVMVRNEAEARNYPVGYGNSVTFKDESAPFVYTKTMGYSQMQPPVFEKYRLVKEEIEETVPDAQAENRYDEIKDEIAKIWAELDEMKTKRGKKKDDE